MNHDGGPSPMYWVFWMVFRMARLFGAFQGFLNCSKSSQKDLEGSKWFLGSLDILGVLGCNWRSLDVWWACLGSSRIFGLRQVLAGQSFRHQVGVAHSRSGIEVVGVREQLGGQGVLCVEVCCCMGWVVPPNHPLVGGIPCFP